jgi:hypothetical protein
MLLIEIASPFDELPPIDHNRLVDRYLAVSQTDADLSKYVHHLMLKASSLLNRGKHFFARPNLATSITARCSECGLYYDKADPVAARISSTMHQLVAERISLRRQQTTLRRKMTKAGINWHDIQLPSVLG